ncbi:MAG TPA: ABC transporter permease, partial [bacterium]|nr:ABC transporter permease [bacterium]
MTVAARREINARPLQAAAAGRHLLVAPAAVLLLGFFVLPYLNLLVISTMTPSPTAAYLRVFTLGNYARVVGDAFTWGVILHTLQIGGLTTALALLVSYPLAYHLARAPQRRKGLLMALVISPLLVGVLIRTYGWMILLQDTGLINQALQALGLRPLALMYNDLGVLIGLVHVFIP